MPTTIALSLPYQSKCKKLLAKTLPAMYATAFALHVVNSPDPLTRAQSRHKTPRLLSPSPAMGRMGPSERKIKWRGKQPGRVLGPLSYLPFEYLIIIIIILLSHETYLFIKPCLFQHEACEQNRLTSSGAKKVSDPNNETIACPIGPCKGFV